jgi:hypothetical protein
LQIKTFQAQLELTNLSQAARPIGLQNEPTKSLIHKKEIIAAYNTSVNSFLNLERK